MSYIDVSSMNNHDDVDDDDNAISGINWPTNVSLGNYIHVMINT